MRICIQINADRRVIQRERNHILWNRLQNSVRLRMNIRGIESRNQESLRFQRHTLSYLACHLRISGSGAVARSEHDYSTRESTPPFDFQCRENGKFCNTATAALRESV